MKPTGAKLMIKCVGITVAVHWILVGIALLIRGDLTREVHWFYESPLLKVILLADLPAVGLTEAIVGPMSPLLAAPPLPHNALLILITTLQWAAIGVLIGRLIKFIHSVPRHEWKGR